MSVSSGQTEVNTWSAGKLAFYRGTNLSMIIDASSNVGIGTTSPQVRFSVQGSQNNTIAPANAVSKFVGGDAGVFIGNLAGTPNYGAWLQAMRESDGLTFPLHLQPNGGNVGIGITAPTAMLHIANPASGNDGLVFQKWAYTTSTTGVYELALKQTVTSGVVRYNFSMINASTAYNDVLVLDRGSIGIGTTSPIGKLTIREATTSIEFNTDANGSYMLSFDRTAGSYKPMTFRGGEFIFSPSDSEKVRITNAGNVGIGTTSPTEALDVRGTIRVSRSGVNDSGILAFGNFLNGAGYFDNGIFRSALNAPSTSGNILHMASYEALVFTAGTAAFGSQTIRMFINGSNGYIGIANTSPQALLHVAGTVSYGSIRVTPSSANGESAIAFFTDTAGTDTNDSWVVGHAGWGHTGDFVIGNENNGAGGNVRLLIEKGGNVGIGTTGPAYTLDVSGTIRATGDVIAYSDARVKENVNTITDALTKVTSLRGVTYTRKDNEDKSRKVGVIAQEVLPILPEVVQQDDNGNYSVAYGNMVGVLIEAIKEQQKQIDELKYLLQNK